MREDDKIRCRHMLDAAIEAQSFVEGRSRWDLDSDRQLTLSLIKSIEVIGEAASRVSDSSRDQFPAIPWQQMIATRNRLVHGYFDVNPDILWQTVKEDLPLLISLLEAAIPTPADSSPESV